jgi:sugar diacid utilization regulator
VAIERTRELVLIAAVRAPEMSLKELRAKLNEALTSSGSGSLRFFIGISAPVSGIEGVRQGYKEARRAVEIGQALEPDELVYFYDDYVLQDVLDAGAKAGKRLVCGSLGRLLGLGETGRRLIDTLEAYFRAGAHLKVAAALLDIHPNTLAYRMRQIHRLTGLDPENPEDRLRAEIAIRLLSLHRRKEEVATREPPAAPPKSRGAGRRSERLAGA